MDWYYVEDGTRVGPLSQEALREQAESGRVSEETLVWHEGMSEWEPYGIVRAREQAKAATPEAATAQDVRCAGCQRVLPVGDTVPVGDARFCADCRPEGAVEDLAGVPGEQYVGYGGFWIRVVAKIVDGVLLMVVNTLVGLALFAVFRLAGAAGTPGTMLAGAGVRMLAQIAVGAAYTTWFLGRFGATPGKMVCSLKVVRPDGAPISYWRAFGRHFAEWLSGILFLIGYLMVAFDSQKRALHDHICDTRVVRVQR